MTFERQSKYHQTSDCGRYTVCWVSGTFEAWRGSEQLEVGLATAEEARAACECHASKNCELVQ